MLRTPTRTRYCAYAALAYLLSLSGSAPALPDVLHDADYHLGSGINLGKHLLLQPGGELRAGFDTNYLQNSGLTEALFPDEPKPGGTRFSVIPFLTLRSPLPELYRAPAPPPDESEHPRDPYESEMEPYREAGDGDAGFEDEDEYDEERDDHVGDEASSKPTDQPNSPATARDRLSPWYGFRLDLEGGFHAIQAESGEDSSALSSQSHFFGATLARAEALPHYFVGADLAVGANRYQEPRLLAETNSAYRRRQLLLDMGLNGRVLEDKLRARVGFTSTKNDFDQFPNLDHHRRAYTLRTSYELKRLFDVVAEGQTEKVDFTADTTEQSNADAWLLAAGPDGYLTDELQVMARAGWSKFDFDSGEDLSAPYANTEITYHLTPVPELHPGRATAVRASATWGYVHDGNVSYLGNYYQRDRAYGRGLYAITESFVFSLEGGFEHIRRPRALFPDGVLRFERFSENRLDGTAYAEIRLGPEWGLGFSLTYQQNFSKSNIPIASDDISNTNAPGFTRLGFFSALRWAR